MSDIIEFPNPSEYITQTVTIDGTSVDICIYKADDNIHWLLEIEDESGGSTVWDDLFPTSQAALDTALKAIETDGIDSFADDDSDEVDLSWAQDFHNVNRYSITIRCKQAYVDWTNSTTIKHKITLDDANDESTVFLIDVVNEFSRFDRDAIVKPVFKTIFESELMGWCGDIKQWPRKRDWQLFQQFFDYSVGSEVFDIGLVPLRYPDLDDE